MFKKNTVQNGETHIKQVEELAQVPAIMNLMLLLKALAEETATQPKIYQNADKTNIRVQFTGSCVDTADFLDTYGALIGEINKEYPIVINGLVNQMEEGTLLVNSVGEKCVFTKQSSSGDDFNTLSHLYLRADFAEVEICDFAYTAVKNFRQGQNFVALPRTWDGCSFTKGIFESSDVLYFRYLPVSDQATDVYEELAEILSTSQATELWVRFLQGGASWAEFETVQALVASGNYDGLYKWELALKLAVEKIGMTINFEDGVTVTKQNGEKLQIGYNNSTGAEKLFAKMIFPA